MKEHLILFKPPMVQAILSDNKTQTRRVLEIPDNGFHNYEYSNVSFGVASFKDRSDGLVKELCIACPYGEIGHQLLVKETFYAYGRWEWRYSEKKKRMETHFIDLTHEMDRIYQYAAEPLQMIPEEVRTDKLGWYKRPSIFMPRRAIRIQLEITNIRVERLQDISERDALAEGCKPIEGCKWHTWEEADAGIPMHDHTARDAFSGLWAAINGEDSRTANPWVWVIEFKRVERTA